jgi:hypothetical protein
VVVLIVRGPEDVWPVEFTLEFLEADPDVPEVDPELPVEEPN